ncbi:MAG: TolC family protein, partial [Alphaproteobacteria bacterium]|nr:TolC family protein [Alphaproteobacteria bacterium]
MGNNAAAISYHAPSTPAWHWLATAQGQTDNGQAENGQTNNDQGTSDATKGDNPNFTITLPTPAPSSSAPMLSLREALTMAYKTDPRLRASMENIRAQRANLDATRALRLPQMTLSSNYGRSQVAVNGVTQDYAGEQKSYSLGVSAPLFTFGRQEASEKAAASQLRSANIAFEQKKIEVFNDVINTYFGVMLAQEIYKLRWQNHQLLNKQLADAMTRFDRRAITITDLRGVRARLNNDAINLIDSESQLISQQQKLTRLLNQPTNSGRDYAEAKNNSGENKIVGSNLSIASSAEFLKKIP